MIRSLSSQTRTFPCSSARRPEPCGPYLPRGHVLEWLFRNFYVEYLISIRREMEKGGGYLTLANFLIELEKYSETVLTRVRCTALYEESVLKQHGIPDRHFDQKLGAMCHLSKTDRSTDCISSDSIRRARVQLEADTQKAVNFANWFIAGRAARKVIHSPLGN